MRAYSAEYDLPDGVATPERVASTIAAELKQAQRLRAAAARGYRLPLVKEGEATRRNRLLARARRGEARAIQELWDRYQLRLIKPERRCQECGGPWGPGWANGQCRRCYNRGYKRARLGCRPRHRGPCRCGCGRPGRGGSGYAAGCYRREYWRRRGVARAWRWATGSARTLQQVRLELLGIDGTPSQREALAIVQRLLTRLEEGRMLLERNPWVTRRAQARPA